MSGRDVVRELRERGTLGRPARTAINIDLLLGVIAVIAIAGCAYVGFGALNWPQPPATPVAVAQAIQDAVWTEADTAKCRAAARAAAKEEVPAELAMANQAVTGSGFSSLATTLACRATTSIARLCDPAQKAAFVAEVSDYVIRLDVVVTGLNVQGGSMALIGGMLGVENGASAYDLSKDDTIAYLNIYHLPVVAAAQALARAGLLSASDFGFFLGMGVSPTISHMFEGIQPDHAVCV